MKRVGVSAVFVVALLAVGANAAPKLAREVPPDSKCCVDGGVTATYSAATGKVTVSFNRSPLPNLRPLEVLVASKLDALGRPDAGSQGDRIERSPPYPAGPSDIYPPVTLDGMKSDFYVAVMYDCLPPRDAPQCGGYQLLDFVWSKAVKVTVASAGGGGGGGNATGLDHLDAKIDASFDPKERSLVIGWTIPRADVCTNLLTIGTGVDAQGDIASQLYFDWLFDNKACLSRSTARSYDMSLGEFDREQPLYVQIWLCAAAEVRAGQGCPHPSKAALVIRLKALRFVPGAPPVAHVGKQYSPFPFCAPGPYPGRLCDPAFTTVTDPSGGTPPYTFNLKIGGGFLPKGLVLNHNTGRLAGTPEKAGTSAFTVCARDSTGETRCVRRSIHVLP